MTKVFAFEILILINLLIILATNFLNLKLETYTSFNYSTISIFKILLRSVNI